LNATKGHSIAEIQMKIKISEAQAQSHQETHLIHYENVSATILLDSLSFSKLPLKQSPGKKSPLVHSPAAYPLYTTPSTVTSLYPLFLALHHLNVSLASRQLVREAGAVVRFGVGV
jgi:hypothetical protein